MFEIVTTEGTIETIPGAAGYLLEGPLTTFFSADAHLVGRASSARLSAFSSRIASFRTDRIVAVRRVEDAAGDLGQSRDRTPQVIAS